MDERIKKVLLWVALVVLALVVAVYITNLARGS
jgi:flagellar basal body-associated protein FliL